MLAIGLRRFESFLVKLDGRGRHGQGAVGFRGDFLRVTVPFHLGQELAV